MRQRSKRQQRRGFQQKRLRVESLEKRVLLAADVFVCTVDGDLLIASTDHNADLTVFTEKADCGEGYSAQVTTAGGIYVNGELYTGEHASSSYSWSGSFTSGRIRIITGDGNDKINVVGNAQDVSIDTRSGYDRVSVENMTIDRDLSVSLGFDDDQLTLCGVHVGGTARLNGGRGFDRLNEGYLDLNTAGKWRISGFDYLGDAPFPRSSVTVEIIDGNLMITGDDAACNLKVEANSDGSYTISPNGFCDDGSPYGPWGYPTSGGAITTSEEFAGYIIISLGGGDDQLALDGEFSNPIQIFAGEGNDEVHVGAEIVHNTTRANADFFIDMGGGDDVVRTAFFGIYTDRRPDGTLDTAGSLTIRTGEGNDNVDLETVRVEGDVVIDAADGENLIEIDCLSAGGDTLIHTGDGNDQVRAGLASVGGDILVATGDGDDQVSLLRGSRDNGGDMVAIALDWFGSSVSQDSCAGIEGAVKIDTGAGCDSVSLSRLAIEGNAEVLTGAGDDFLSVSNVYIHGDMTLAAGDGADEIVLSGGVLAGDTLITAGNGDDVVSISQNSGFPYSDPWPMDGAVPVTLDSSVNIADGPPPVSFDRLTIEMGGGNDGLSVEYVHITDMATLDGGEGTDSLNEDYRRMNTAGAWNVSAFENVDDYVSPPATTSNVTVEIIDGNLVITGDATSNYVFVRRNVLGQCWVVVADEPGFPASWVELVPLTQSPPHDYEVSGDVVISLGGGDDCVGLYGDYAGNIVINTGEGNDQIDFLTACVEGNLSIAAESGNDSVVAKAVIGDGNVNRPGSTLSVHGDMTLEMGHDNDSVVLPFTKVQGTAHVDAGAGNDVVRIGASLFAGDLTVMGATGTDGIEIISLATIASFPDLIMWPTGVQGNLTVRAGDDDDTVSIRNADITGAATLDGGEGTDSLNEDCLSINTAGVWNILSFENIVSSVPPDAPIGIDDPMPIAVPPDTPLVGPFQRLTQTVQRRRLTGERQNLTPPTESEKSQSAPGGESDDSATAQAAAHDAAMRTWQQAVTRRRGRDRDNVADDLLQMLLSGV